MVECQLPKLNTRVRFPSLAPIAKGFEKILSYTVVLLFFVVSFSGCVSVPARHEDKAVEVIPAVPVTVPAAAVAGPKPVYHKVAKKETLWKIAQQYHVTIDDIIQSNSIPNVAHLDENQLIIIPQKRTQKEISEAKTATTTVSSAWDNEFSWPLQGRILNYFGDRNGGAQFKGIRIQGKEGENVLAARQGRVVFADYLPGYAYTVILDHEDGYFSVYAQNQKILVKLGDIVAKGNPLGQVGRRHNQSFLHFEIRKNGRADNPLYYLPKA